MTQTEVILPASTVVGRLGIMHLERYLAKAMAMRSGALAPDALPDEWKTDVTLLSTLGLGLEQTIIYIYQNAPSIAGLEDWILEVNSGKLSEDKIALFNAVFTGSRSNNDEPATRVLDVQDIAFWDKNGYVIIRNAVSKQDCDNTIGLICEELEIDRYDPATWYNEHKLKQGIMVQLFQHEQLQRNRDTEIIRQAYEQLWGRTDIWVNTDRVGFNPPETSQHKFRGPHLHWDVSIKPPVPFGLQGILYLSDTAANQGAFTLVPGFQHRLEGWLNSLPPGADPRKEDMYALGATPVAANAGDFIIWHHVLPHGSSPNTAALPRFVQYINYEPINPEVNNNWK